VVVAGRSRGIRIWDNDVVLMYLNRGQAYCSDPGVKDCGAVRTAKRKRLARF